MIRTFDLLSAPIAPGESRIVVATVASFANPRDPKLVSVAEEVQEHLTIGEIELVGSELTVTVTNRSTSDETVRFAAIVQVDTDEKDEQTTTVEDMTRSWPALIGVDTPPALLVTADEVAAAIKVAIAESRGGKSDDEAAMDAARKVLGTRDAVALVDVAASAEEIKR